MARKNIAELVRFAIIAAAIVIPFRLLVAQPFLVSGDSMLPSFHNNDYLIVDEISYRFRPPARGEVVVFRSPVEPSKYLIKRITGLPGETVHFSFPQETTPITGLATELTLANEEYFVQGDNNAASFDSRYWGALPRENIKGRALIQLWPPSKIGFVP